jgi:hypothetical protein
MSGYLPLFRQHLQQRNDLPTEIAQNTAVDIECRTTMYTVFCRQLRPSQTPVALGWICPVGAGYVILVVEDLTCLE